MKRQWLSVVGGLGCALGMLAALHLGLASPAAADPIIHYVAPPPLGNDNTSCSESAPCATIQHAAGLATSGDEIRVAQGVYSDIHSTGSVTQVLYLNKTLTVCGGYSSADWSTAYPLTQPTVLDAHDQGRGIYIVGAQPVIEGLHITGGSASRGGGVFVAGTSATLRNNYIHHNTATEYGGGVYLQYSNSILSNNVILSNTAQDRGGGVYLFGGGALLTANELGYNHGLQRGGGVCLYTSTATLTDNTIHHNSASTGGGGAYLHSSPGATLAENTIVSNTADTYGGGVYFYDSDATLADSFIGYNEADYGGGVYLQGNSGAIVGNVIVGNAADSYGGGISCLNNTATISTNHILGNVGAYGGAVSLSNSNGILSGNTLRNNQASRGGGGYISNSDEAVLEFNTLIANTSAAYGGGVYVYDSDVRLNGNTIAQNVGNERGGGVYLSTHSNAVLQNNVIVENQLNTGNGSGVYIGSSSPRLLHNTLARNRDGAGDGIYATKFTGDVPSTVTLTNTIIVSQTRGIYVSSGNTATLAAPLWGAGIWANGANAGGGGTILITDAVAGDPAFKDYLAGDYHLTYISAAIDGGVAAGVIVDRDGDPRDDLAPDQGAYELRHEDSDTVVKVGLAEGARASFGPTRVGITVTQGSVGIVTVTKHLIAPGGHRDAGEIAATWYLTASHSPFTVTLALCYTPAEVTGLNEGTLHAFRWNSATLEWENQGGTPNSATHCVTLPGVVGFSAWTLFDTTHGEPMAITLRDFTGRAAPWRGGGLLVGLLLGGRAFIRRRAARLP